MKRNLLIAKHLLITILFTIRNVIGYWRKDKLLPMTLVIGVHNKKEGDWWIREVNKLNTRFKKLSKK